MMIRESTTPMRDETCSNVRRVAFETLDRIEPSVLEGNAGVVRARNGSIRNVHHMAFHTESSNRWNYARI